MSNSRKRDGRKLTDADVECHEGRQIIFVDPRTVHTLDWSRGLAAALPRVVGHAAYVGRFGRPEPHAVSRGRARAAISPDRRIP